MSCPHYPMSPDGERGECLSCLKASLATAAYAQQAAEHVADEVRAQLAAAISGGADAAAQRDTALGLCKERERRIDELKLAMGDEAGWFDRYTAERAAHAATQGHLQSAREMRDTYHRLNLEAREELAETRKKLEAVKVLQEGLVSGLEMMLESTRAALARSEARVRELEHRCLDAWNIMHNLSASENLDGSERVVVERWLADNG